ncbi:glycoside hydrolase family 47 protein [Peniophora sp. CONT]|nr:glycoside hydrolase family 47 protein [Peniophora sp. CONT]
MAARLVKQEFDVAAPHDELLPVSRGHIDNFNGWGVTLHDSLDTMLLMNLTDIYRRAYEQVEQADFWLHPGRKAPFFETAIRHVGGLLSAYAISGDAIMLEKADLLARKLSPVFNTESGLPQYSVNPSTSVPSPCVVSDRKTVCLAEVASCQPEYSYLSKATGHGDHVRHANKVWHVLQNADVSNFGGMLPTDWRVKTGVPNDEKLTAGAQGDSAHEYLLKQYILTGKTDKALLEMYLRMTTHMITRMLWMTPKRKILFPVATRGVLPKDIRERTFEHLACFLPGLLALGVQHLPLDDLASVGVDFQALGNDLSPAGQAEYELVSHYKLSDLHRWAAAGLGEACAVMYADQPTGLAPDEAQMTRTAVRWIDQLEAWRQGGNAGTPPGVGPVIPVRGKAGFEFHEYELKRFVYELRPETIESMFVLWRTTRDERWRVHGWNMFQAIVRSARKDTGYASVLNVEEWPPSHKDSMPRLKYLYLLFSGEELVPLDKWVFNTEAHPMPVFMWTAEEKAKFGLQ